MRKKIEEVLHEQIRPFLATHGGGVELIDYQEGQVYLKMFGGCQGCAASAATLKDGIESILKEEIPEIQGVVDLTEHESGKNPYFTPSDFHQDHEEEES